MSAHDTIVVSSITGIGSTILATPMLKALRRARPGARIILLVRFEAARQLLLRGSVADEIIVCDYASQQSMARKFAFLGWLRAQRPNVFINAFPSNRLEKNLLACLSGAPVRVGHRCANRRVRNMQFLMSHPVDVDCTLHDVEQDLRLLGPLDIPTQDADMRPEVWTSPAAQSCADERLRGFGSAPIVGMHPGSSAEQGMLYKRWPADRFAELGRCLAVAHDARVLVFGGPEECGLKQHVAGLIGAAASVIDAPIEETAAIIQRLHAFVANDSGLMHIAAATGTPTVGIFGPTDQRRTAPFGSHTAVVRAGTACSPCWRTETLGEPLHCAREHMDCLDGVSVGDVARAVESIAFSPVHEEAGTSGLGA